MGGRVGGGREVGGGGEAGRSSVNRDIFSMRQVDQQNAMFISRALRSGLLGNEAHPGPSSGPIFVTPPPPALLALPRHPRELLLGFIQMDGRRIRQAGVGGGGRGGWRRN